MSNNKRPRYSIVIPCFNEAEYITKTLKSLRQQTYRGGYEVIVVDNNCTDNTVALAKKAGARVVFEPNPGVCWARDSGSRAAKGEIIISTDADTLFSPDWLANIDRHFNSQQIVAVAGPCRYLAGPWWANFYVTALFNSVNLVRKLTGRTIYASATNIAFRADAWQGYDTTINQGGDELGLLRQMRDQGQIYFDNSNPTYTSPRRLQRGMFYNFFVTFMFYYVLEYNLNRMFNRDIIGAMPAYRDRMAVKFSATTGLAIALSASLILTFSLPRHLMFEITGSIFDEAKSVVANRF